MLFVWQILFGKACDAMDAFVVDEDVVFMRWICPECVVLWSERTQRTDATRVLEILLEHKIPRRLGGGVPACPQENKPKSEGTELLKEILTRLFLWVGSGLNRVTNATDSSQGAAENRTTPDPENRRRINPACLEIWGKGVGQFEDKDANSAGGIAICLYMK